MKKYTVLFLLLITAAILSGCSAKTENKNDISETNAADTESCEWSITDFSSVMCRGINISVPCKPEDIDEHFDTEEGSGFIALYLDGEYVGTLYYGDGDELTDYVLSKYDIMGLSDKSAKSDIQKKLGRGNFTDSNYADCFKKEGLTLAFTYYDETKSIIIFGISNNLQTDEFEI